MNTFFLYQANLTDEQIAELNAHGWAAHPAYAHIIASLYEDEAWERVQAALGYYSHVANVEAANVEGVFETTNIGPEEAITRHRPMKSGAVGDVVYDMTNGEMFICCSWGWYQMKPVEMGEFLATVPTKMGIAA